MEAQTVSATRPAAHPPTMTPADRKAHGKRLRDTVRRDAHTGWRPAADRPDPIGILRAADATRQPDLAPLRYGRMLQSPFTFYRGSAGVMAADLAHTPVSGINVQVCGDCHLMNFGGFATPERRLIFDINDLDETLPAPWEWDVKRLVASFVLAARSNGLSDANGRDAAVACARSYRQKMRDFAAMDVLDVWYARLDDSDALAMLPQDRRALLSKRIAKATARGSSELVYPKAGRGLRCADPHSRHPSDHFSCRCIACCRRPGDDPGVAPKVSRNIGRRSPRSIRSLPASRRGSQGGRHRQRRHLVHGGADDVGRR